MPNLFRFRTLLLTLTLTMLSLGGTLPVQAGTSISSLPIKPEHVKAGPPIRPGQYHAAAISEPETTTFMRRAGMMTPNAPATAASNASMGFLTRPYTTWHNITSVFDHCNPDYTSDGKVCEFDGSVGYSSYGVDPSFSLGYAQSPGGSNYLYYDGHNGWDYAMYYENVLAAADGVVRLAGSDPYNPCFGQTITIDHLNGYTTRYAHLSQIYVTPGQSVARAQVIAQSGNTGCSTGPHLHFGVYVTSSWTAIDPWGWWGAPGADPWPSDPGDLWLTGTAQFPLPFAPTNVTAAAGNGSATVSWTAPAFNGGTSISTYTVTATPGGVTVTVPGSVTSAVMTGLTNGTSYTFAVTAQTSTGATQSSASNGVIPSGWIGLLRPITPTRILDTRSGLGGVGTPLGAGQSIDVQITGRGGVPASGVADVVLNVTATRPTQGSYLTVYPTGTTRPATSNLNFQAGQTVARLVVSGIGTGGRVTVYNAAGSTDVLLDVSGWYAAQGTTSGTAGVFRAVAPLRVLDTRTTGASPIGAGHALDVQVTGRGGVPATGVSAVLVNLTTTNATAPGWVAAYPSGTALPPTSAIDFAAAQTVANRAIVGVGTAGKITIFNALGSTDVLVDVGGWFADGSDATLTGGLYTGATPTRVLDTRVAGGPLGAGVSLVTIAGLAGIPPMSAPVPPKAVMLSVTVTNPTAEGFVSVYASGSPQPSTSDLNFVPGLTVSNLVVAPLGADGKIAVFNPGGKVDLIVDVLGWSS